MIVCDAGGRTLERKRNNKNCWHKHFKLKLDSRLSTANLDLENETQNNFYCCHQIILLQPRVEQGWPPRSDLKNATLTILILINI